MIKAEAVLRAWGNSIGVVLPKDDLRNEHLKVNDAVEITIRKTDNPLRAAFGKLKPIMPTDDLIKIMRKDIGSKYVK